MDRITLRAIVDDDLPLFFNLQLDKDAVRMAAFTAKDPTDRAAFDLHWEKIRSDGSVLNRTVLVNDRVAGYVAGYLLGEERHVCYWIDRNYWGKGVATTALALLLELIPERPLYASAAGDNRGSIRVLEKCGFRYSDSERAFANARNEEIDEAMFILD